MGELRYLSLRAPSFLHSLSLCPFVFFSIRSCAPLQWNAISDSDFSSTTEGQFPACFKRKKARKETEKEVENGYHFRYGCYISPGELCTLAVTRWREKGIIPSPQRQKIKGGRLFQVCVCVCVCAYGVLGWGPPPSPSLSPSRLQPLSWDNITQIPAPLSSAVTPTALTNTKGSFPHDCRHHWLALGRPQAPVSALSINQYCMNSTLHLG